jgi:hypothetical protein
LPTPTNNLLRKSMVVIFEFYKKNQFFTRLF